MTPRAALTKHLLDGDDSFFTGKFDKPQQTPAAPVTSPPTPPAHPTSTPFDTDAT
jgi:sec-independent protein translocase protein TatB